MEEPQWVEVLLSTAFFYICPRHGSSPRNECNMFCISCQGYGFCVFCRSSHHIGHPVIQIRKSSYHNVVRVSEIERELNISGVQTYVINSANIVFLNKRPHPKISSTAAAVSSNHKTIYFCEICSRTLLDPFRFCSLGCKFEGVKKNKEEEEERLRKERQEETHKGTHRPNSRRRKGIPHRASFHPLLDL